MALTTRRATRLGLALGLLGCGGIEPPPPAGVDVPEGPCGHALVVASSDYVSTSIAIVGFDGEVLSPAMLTSGSEAPGLSVALSGDVVLPSERTRSGRVVLVDRYPASTITFLDPVEASVTGQVNVQTGFAANPQDVLELDDGRALVARYERNLDAGKEPFDEGSDLLVVDPERGSLEGRIDLTPAMAGEDPAILPRPARLRRVGGHVVVLLAAYSADFLKSGDARLAIVDATTSTVTHTLALDGLRGCSGIDVAPDDARVVVGCSGTFGGSATPSIDDAGIAVVSVAPSGELAEVARIGAGELGGDPIGFSIAFASDDTVLVPTFGRTGDDPRDDHVLEVALESGAARDLLASSGEPFTLGDVRCAPACGACYVTDAGRGVLHRFELEDGAAGARAEITIDDGIGLPPRYLGAY